MTENREGATPSTNRPFQMLDISNAGHLRQCIVIDIRQINITNILEIYEIQYL